MERFLSWFNAEDSGLDAALKAGLAHLWFVTIHPFDDGNGRIARAIGDMALRDWSRRPIAFTAFRPRLKRSAVPTTNPGAIPEGDDGRDPLAGMVPGLPVPRP